MITLREIARIIQVVLSQYTQPPQKVLNLSELVLPVKLNSTPLAFDDVLPPPVAVVRGGKGEPPEPVAVFVVIMVFVPPPPTLITKTAPEG